MNLFVGSLPFDLKEDELKNLFAAIGEVISAKIICDRETGRSRGFGFVEMKEEADGNEAIEKLNGSNIGGRNIVVNKAHKK